jgi:arsenite-transporting ATPase
MANVYDQWISKITKLREEMREYEQMAARISRQTEMPEDQILAELQDIKYRISTSSSILTDREKTAFFFVLVPEEMILIDTMNASTLFEKYDVPISGYITNRVLPARLMESENTPEYLRNRFDMQQKYLQRIDDLFGKDVLANVQEMERDVTGLPMIAKMADVMFGEESLS